MNRAMVDRLRAALEGRYALERELGEGGMATVYLARDLKHNRNVALKVLKPELAAVVGAERFLAEIETTANLQHPHILPLFDSGEADGFLFYVMPYVEGETLADRIRREKQLPVDEALGIATSVASALQHAHDRGIIHRDIKPGNILLQDGQPVVGDFGIALAVGSAGGARLTETGLSVGTPYYMSPEQATGDQVVGPASDTYALACVLYEMLTGEPPYPGNTAQAVLGKIIQGLPVSATAVRRSVPLNVDAAIRRALEKLPADRFTGAQAFAKALGDPTFRHGDHVAAAGAGPGPWKAIAAALAVTLVAMSFWAMRPAADVPRGVQRFEAPFREGQAPLVPAGLLGISPDGAMAAYVGPGEGVEGQIWVRRWDDLEATPLRGTDGTNIAHFSPDGSELAFMRGTELNVLPLQGGPIRSLSVNGQLTAWGADGYLYVGGGGVGLSRVHPSGGLATRITPQDQPEFQAITWVLPGGERALMFGGTSPADAQVRIVDLGTGEMHPLMAGIAPIYTETGHLVYLTAGGLLMGVPFDARALEVRGDPVALIESVGGYALSPSGTLIYYTDPANSQSAAEVEPVWVTRSGEIAPVDDGWTFDRGGDANFGFRVSPDGTRLAVRAFASGNYDIWIKLLEPGGPFSRLTRHEAEDRMPRWSPDGVFVTFLSGRNGSMDVWQQRADGTGQAELLYDSEAQLAQGFWSPDGEWLVMRTTTGTGVGGRDIHAIRPGADSVPLLLLAEDYDEAAPAVSPDGRWLAYGSNETGRYEVFVRPFPNVDDGKVQVSNAGGSAPLWSWDGSELFYHDTQATLVAVSFETEPSFRVTVRTPLFTVPEGFLGRGGTNSFITGLYDVAADGRFLMMRSVGAPSATEDSEGERARVILVLNWFEELTRRVPVP
jgi:eukaryotic-like serine/threonine-protein kinase